MPALSLRLGAILDVMRPCRVLGDVGTDHAQLPVAAVSRALAGRAVATDLRAAPLQRARDTVLRHGLDGQVVVRRGDGLRALAGESADTVVMAGVSGRLMVRWCGEAPGVLADVTQLILQPTKDADHVREWAFHHGWQLHVERMIEERRRFHVVCAFHPAPGADPAYARGGWATEDLFVVGPLLLRDRDPAASRHWAAQRRRFARLQRKNPALEKQHRLWDAALREASAEQA